MPTADTRCLRTSQTIFLQLTPKQQVGSELWSCEGLALPVVTVLAAGPQLMPMPHLLCENTGVQKTTVSCEAFIVGASLQQGSCWQCRSLQALRCYTTVGKATSPGCWGLQASFVREQRLDYEVVDPAELDSLR